MRAEHVEVEIGEPVAFEGRDPLDVVRFAALGAPPGTDDRLDQALVADAALRGLALPPSVPVGHTDPDDRHRFAITTVRQPDGDTLQIARGDPRAVVEVLIHPGSAERARAILASVRLTAGAFRPLAVATRVGRADLGSADLGSPDTGVTEAGGPAGNGGAVSNGGAVGNGGVGERDWRLLGYLPVRAWTLPERRRGRPFDYQRVWDLWLRIAHWTWVAAILALTVTGYIIADPGWVPSAWTIGPRAGNFMSYVRYVHLVAAAVFMLVLVVRAWNLSTSKIPYDRWRALVPFRSRRELRNLFQTLRAYLFIRADTAPVYFGHNPLQQLAYTAIYVVFLLQVLTGLALWGLYDSHAVFWSWFQWLNELLGTQQVRLLHQIIMWVIVLFLPAHVYLSIRADSVERSGAISSMVSGGRWIRRGAVFEDWPPKS
jgi:Ni/Fe-hydrogenase b-type cytochrome subunit